MNLRPDYWQHKLSLWLHDPVHKALDIALHESRAKDIAEFLHQTSPSKDAYQAADVIASGLTRSVLPKFSSDETQNGAVNFLDYPTVTHPLVRNTSLSFEVPKDLDINQVHEEIKQLLKTDLGLELSEEELS